MKFVSTRGSAPAADLSSELTDYEDRRKRDRHKLDEMVRYCRTARCRTRMIMEYFGETQPDAPRWNPAGYLRNVVETVRVTVA